jgi:signal transduction histidine kinase
VERPVSDRRRLPRWALPAAGRGRRLHPWVVDGLLAGLLTALAVAGLVASPPQPQFPDPDALAGLVSLGQTLPLAFRRRRPGTVLVVVWLATGGYLLLGYPPNTTALLGAMVATYSVAAYGAGRTPVVGALFAAGVIAVVAAAAAGSGADATLTDLAAAVLVFLTAWVLGDRMRTRRAYTTALEERAQRLEQERQAQAKAAVRDERTRIARELHDVVAHNVSVIVVQATAAGRVLDSDDADPAGVREALGTIEATGRAALAELRTVLGVLRTDDQDDHARTPQPGLAKLPELVQHTRQAGLPVELWIRGERRALPPGVDLSAYRIVQEALTNALKHARPTSATVLVGYQPNRLDLQVSNDDRAASPAGHQRGGQGLVGMRERVLLFGGDFQAGPLAGGGFSVQASFPLDPTPR